jgi:hypothetical protein
MISSTNNRKHARFAGMGRSTMRPYRDAAAYSSGSDQFSSVSFTLCMNW